MAAGGVGPNGDPSLFNFSKELPSWFPWGYGGQSVDPPSLPISPILQDSLDDSVVANVGSSREESSTPSEAVIATQTVVDALPVGMDSGPMSWRTRHRPMLIDCSQGRRWELSPTGGRCFERGPISGGVPSNIENRSGRRVVGALWVAGQIGGL